MGSESAGLIYWMTRSRTVLVGDLTRRQSTAIAWSEHSTGPWNTMATCPVPEDPIDRTWRIVSGAWEYVPLDKVPQ